MEKKNAWLIDFARILFYEFDFFWLLCLVWSMCENRGQIPEPPVDPSSLSANHFTDTLWPVHLDKKTTLAGYLRLANDSRQWAASR